MAAPYRLFEPQRDPLAELLRGSRPLAPERAKARERWFAANALPDKGERLFRFEMLLKGLGCLGERSNLPGEQQGPPPLGWDWRLELRVALDAVDTAQQQARALLGEHGRMLRFQRYVASLASGDAERTRRMQGALAPQTPEEALLSLRGALDDLLEVGETLGAGGPLGVRPVQAWISSVLREVARSPYFDPLVSLEFRPEFDRIEQPELVELLGAVPSEAAQRAAVLTVLGLRRAARYVERARAVAAEAPLPPRFYAWLAVLRSDMRSLWRQLSTRLHRPVADVLERELLRVPAARMWREFDKLQQAVGRVPSLVRTLRAAADNLEADLRRIYSTELPPIERGLGEGSVPRDELLAGVDALGAAVEEALRTVVRELGGEPATLGLGVGRQVERAAAERLRREVWMFQQVLRAFVAKAQASKGERDRWEGFAELRFVKDFAAHFRTLGYHLLRAEDYPALDGFLRALEAVRSADVLEPERLAEMVGQAEAAQRFLQELFEAVGRRHVLQGVPFDRRAAAEALRFHLERGRPQPQPLTPLPPARPPE